MKKPLPKIARQDGFIAIVALGIITLMTVFMISLVSHTTNTYKNLKASKYYYLTESVANSILGHLELKLGKKNFGYNFEQICGPSDFGITTATSLKQSCTTATNDGKDICNNLETYLKSQGVNDVSVKMKISGRAQTNEELATKKQMCPNEIHPANFFVGSSAISGLNPTYLIPFPGQGAAGQDCHVYLQELTQNPDAGKADYKVNNKWKINNAEGVSQLNYSCNWGKLSFGSSSTDRVNIPLYYATDSDIVNPFNKETTNNKATKFIVRLRTPCIKTDLRPGEEEKCERYKLNESDGNDIIVQWQLTGTCPVGTNGKEEECGLIQSPDSYLLNENMINGNNGSQLFTNYKVLRGDATLGEDLTNGKDPLIDKKLSIMKKPIFSLFLNKKLLTTANTRIPYLEYQIITDQPIGDAETKIEVQITINGTYINKTIYKKSKKDLIDFAIQN